jgi:cell wall-associated NlpC family hydrolase
MLSVSSCKILLSKAPEKTSFKENIYTKKIISKARNYTGVPYKSGGNDEKGLDCSGLLCISFNEIGIKLPRISWQQAEYFPAINLRNIQKGDLVFFATVNKNVSHAGIVTEVKTDDDIRFIHASLSKGVIEDNMMANYWKSRFVKVCRPQFTKTIIFCLINKRF